MFYKVNYKLGIDQYVSWSIYLADTGLSQRASDMCMLSEHHAEKHGWAKLKSMLLKHCFSAPILFWTVGV